VRRFNSIVKDHLALGAAFSVSTPRLSPVAVYASSHRKSVGHFNPPYRGHDLRMSVRCRYNRGWVIDRALRAAIADAVVALPLVDSARAFGSMALRVHAEPVTYLKMYHHILR
jgi:hypothetical protein